MTDLTASDTVATTDWRRLSLLATDRLVAHFDKLGVRSALPTLGDEAIRARVDACNFAQSRSLDALVGDAADLLAGGTVQCNHPRYLGLFNPNVLFAGVIGDLLAAGFNPNLACWSHAPAAVAIESKLVRTLGRLFGFGDDTAGHFTSGGTEANATALVCALTRNCPEYGRRGLSGNDARPALYASRDSHLAWLKIAHQSGIGREAVRLVPTDGGGRMDVAALADAISVDRRNGFVPALIVATAGTTSAGMIDPMHEIADLAEQERAHFHVDAAWGGAAAFSDELRPHLAGIARADSITVDAHKWLAVPMGAGVFLCRDRTMLDEAFAVSTSYMPPGATELDGYTHSMQWSRRFIGLKLFLALGSLGIGGYAKLIEEQTRLGERLRDLLRADGWRIVNDTPLPVICFERDDADAAAVVAAVLATGDAWLSTTSFEGRTVIRACISGWSTAEADLARVVQLLAAARISRESSPPPR